MQKAANGFALPLVWIAEKSSAVHRKRPPSLSMIGEDCAFRAPVAEALDATGIPWANIYEHGTIDATMTVVKTGLALSISLASAVPDDLVALGSSSGLPSLPLIAVNLHVDSGQPNQSAEQLAAHIRAGLYETGKRTA